MKEKVKVDGRVYVSLGTFAKRLDIVRMTAWRWAAKGETPNGDKLDVVKDLLTKQYFVAEETVVALEERYSRHRYERVIPQGELLVEQTVGCV